MRDLEKDPWCRLWFSSLKHWFVYICLYIL
jgi:hypothetical protein